MGNSSGNIKPFGISFNDEGEEGLFAFAPVTGWDWESEFIVRLLNKYVGSSKKQTSAAPKTISGGVVNGKAENLPQPVYPAAARAVRASGSVNVQVLIDENGNVVSANAVSGHPQLRAAAESAARTAKFKPTMLSGEPVKVNGILVFNFMP